MASNQEDMDIDPFTDCQDGSAMDKQEARKLFEGRKVKSDIDKDLAKLKLKNRCPGGIKK